jgi:hypothetical protein
MDIAKNMTKPKEAPVADATRAENAKKLRNMRDKDRQMVKGVFKYYEVPGGSVGFCFKKYKEDPIEKFDLVDGQIYTIPLGVAKHLNSNTWYPIHGHTVDENGVPLQSIKQKVNRMAFQSLEFMDVEDFGSGKQIITVENIIR